MFRSYYKIAWRNLKNNKASSIINIGGLAVGMTVAILIGLWIYDELSFNKSFDNYNRIAWVMQHTTSNGITSTQTPVPLPLSKELQTNYSGDFKYVVRAAWQNEHILTYGDKNLSESGNYMDADAPRMLSLKMQAGNYNGLSEFNSILLSSSAAKAIFGNADPINKLIKIDDQFSVKVTGVYKDIPTNTEFNGLHFIAPFSLYITSNPWSMTDQNKWDDNSFLVYAQINDEANFNTVNKHIGNVILNHLRKDQKKSKPLVE